MHPHTYNMLRNRAVRAPADMTAGWMGSGSPAATPAPQQQPAGSGSPVIDPTNFDGDFNLDTQNVWELPTQAPGATQQSQVTQPPVNQPNFDQFVSSMNFMPNELTSQEKLQVQQGDFTPVFKSVEAMIKAVYKKAVTDSVQTALGMSEQARERAVTQAGRIYNDRDGLKMLESKVPLASNPNIRPMAISMFQQQMKRPGMTAEKAAGIVSKAFGAIQGAKPEGFGLAPRPSNTRGGFVQNAEPEPEMDWSEFLQDN